MHLHILGIGGTFMSALALLAREDGHEVTGCDANCYPPVSDLLKAKGISWTEGYDDTKQALKADLIIVGNTVGRGKPVLESIMQAGKPYTSGPQWLADHILPRYRVLAISGTHGKTTTTSMCAFILDQVGFNPGFLIGGVAPNFNTSAKLGNGDWFVIEADEYDSAFFDKRPKFMHYRPNVCVINNLEFDHADIYHDLPAIQQQFHYLLRTVPNNGTVIVPKDDKAINEVLAKGQYSRVETLSIGKESDWCAKIQDNTGKSFEVLYKGEFVAEVNWDLIGRFNVENGLTAIAACANAGVKPMDAATALADFMPVKRRLEVRSVNNDITIYDDFAHHPTAISKTIEAVKNSCRHNRVYVVLEFASFTMRSGIHADKINAAIARADGAYILKPNFNLPEPASIPCEILENTSEIVKAVTKKAQPGDAILVMSNRGFDDIYQQLADAILT